MADKTTTETNREIIDAWWPCAGLRGPFTPGRISGNNDGIVRDVEGYQVADCRGNEAMADVIAALLNREWDIKKGIGI